MDLSKPPQKKDTTASPFSKRQKWDENSNSEKFDDIFNDDNDGSTIIHSITLSKTQDVSTHSSAVNTNM